MLMVAFQALLTQMERKYVSGFSYYIPKQQQFSINNDFSQKFNWPQRRATIAIKVFKNDLETIMMMLK